MAGMAPLGCYLLCLSPLIAVITNWPVYTSGGEEGGEGRHCNGVCRVTKVLVPQHGAALELRVTLRPE